MDRSIEIETPAAGVEMATSDGTTGTITGRTGSATGGLGRTWLSPVELIPCKVTAAA